MPNVCHIDEYQGPHYTILHIEKETEDGSECVGLTKKSEQAYGLILGEDDDDDNEHISVIKKKKRKKIW